jgi:AcrR family transcriptional regulator
MGRSSRRLGADDWARAALEALGEGGVAAVRVEALAPRVGASKGSFYWHFADRAALIDAALAIWERESTEAVIAELEAIEDAPARLRRLFALAFGDRAGGRVDAGLAAHAGDPQVGPVLRRVTQRRLAFLEATYRELGHPPATARHRALAAYSAYIGLYAVRLAAPAAVPEPLDAYLDELLAMLERA